MRRLVGLILAWLICTALVAEARFTRSFWVPPSNAILPFQGLGDILQNVVTYHSVSSCYQNNALNQSVVILKDQATGTVSTTLGCNNGPIGSGRGTPTVIAGSPIATTCATLCVIDTLYDQSSGKNCSSAVCNLTQTQNNIGRSNPRVLNPIYVANCDPDGVGYCAHFQGWADGASGSSGGVASGTYNNTTGVLVLTTTPTVYYVVGSSIHITSLTCSPSACPAGFNGDFQVTAVSAHTITYNPGAGLGAGFSITGGNYVPNTQTLNNDVGTFAQVNEPYTVAALMTCDGFQNAGTSGGPNSNQTQHDAIIDVGCQTTPVGLPNGASTIAMNNGNTMVTACATGCTITQSVSYGSWYSILAVFDNTHNNSWLCINGSCASVNLGGSVNWATGAAGNDGYSEGNGSGGWGGNFVESVMMTGDKHVQATAIYSNQKARYGNF